MVDGLLGVALGLFCVLAGFGTLKVSKDARANAAFVSKWGRLMRIGGAVIILAALMRLLFVGQ